MNILEIYNKNVASAIIMKEKQHKHTFQAKHFTKEEFEYVLIVKH